MAFSPGATTLQEPASRVIAIDLSVAHVAGEHLKAAMARDLLDFEDAGARPRRTGDEPGALRMAAEQRRVVAGVALLATAWTSRATARSLIGSSVA